MIDLEVWKIGLLIVIFFSGYFGQQIAGFGAAIFCLPFSLRLISRELFMPLTLFFTGFQSINIAWINRKKINKKLLFLMLLLAGAAGILFSDFILSCISERVTKALLSCFILVNSGLSLYKIKKAPAVQDNTLKLWHYIYPVCAGILQATYGVGGPFLIAFLSKTIQEKDELRSTMCAFWAILNSVLLIKCTFDGFINTDTVALGAVLLFSVLLGMYAGNRLLSSIDEGSFRSVVHIILLISAAFMFL